MRNRLFNVSVNASINLVFPEHCVVCGRFNNGQQGKIEMTRARSFFPSFIIDRLEQISSKQRIQLIPSHTECLRGVRRSFWKRNIILIFIVTFCLIEGKMNSWNFFLEIILIFIIASPLVFWDMKHPLPVEYMLKDKKLIFTFTDKNYAERFALLNQSKVEISY